MNSIQTDNGMTTGLPWKKKKKRKKKTRERKPREIVERFLKFFMNDFSIFDDSFDDCLTNLEKVWAVMKRRILYWIGKNVILW